MKLFRLNAPDDEALLALSKVRRERIQCARNPGHERAGRRLADLEAAVRTKKALKDFIFCWTPNYLIREYTARRLEMSGLKGFMVRPLMLTTEMKKEPINGYKEFFIHEVEGYGLGCDDIWLKDYCEECGLLGFEFNGDPPWCFEKVNLEPFYDFFKVEPFGHTFVSERAEDVIRSFGIRGLHLLPADEPLRHAVEFKNATMGEPPDCLTTEQRLNLWHQIQRLDRDGLLEGKRQPAWVGAQ